MQRLLISLFAFIFLLSLKAFSAPSLSSLGYGAYNGNREIPVLIFVVDFEDRGFRSFQSLEYYRDFFFSTSKASIKSYLDEISGGKIRLREVATIKVRDIDIENTSNSERLVWCSYGRKSEEDGDKRYLRYTQEEISAFPKPEDPEFRGFGYPISCGEWYWNGSKWSNSHVDSRIKRLVAYAQASGLVNFAELDTNGDGKVDGNELLIITIVPSATSEVPANLAGWGGQHRSHIGGGITVTGSIIGLPVTVHVNPGRIFLNEDANPATILHEFLHSLGLPDMYATDGQCFNWNLAIMSCTGTKGRDGIYKKHSLYPDAYVSMALGWKIPVMLRTDASTCLVVTPSSAGGDIYLFYDESKITDSRTQFFLLEFRKRVNNTYDGFVEYAGGTFSYRDFEGKLNSKVHGLVLWHVLLNSDKKTYNIDSFAGDEDYKEESLHYVPSDAASDITKWGRGSEKPSIFVGDEDIEPVWVSFNDDGLPVSGESSGLKLRVVRWDHREDKIYLEVNNGSCDLPDDDYFFLVSDECIDNRRIMRWTNLYYEFELQKTITPCTLNLLPPTSSLLVEWSVITPEWNLNYAVEVSIEESIKISTGTTYTTTGITLNFTDSQSYPLNIPSYLSPARYVRFDPDITVKIYPTNSNQAVEYGDINYIHTVELGESDLADLSTAADLSDEVLPDIDLPPAPLPTLLSPDEDAVIDSLDMLFLWEFPSPIDQTLTQRLCLIPDGGNAECRVVNPQPGLTSKSADKDALQFAGIGLALLGGLIVLRRKPKMFLIFTAALLIQCGGGGGSSTDSQEKVEVPKNPPAEQPNNPEATRFSHKVEGLTPGTSYRWYIETRNKYGMVSVSEVRTFRTK